MAVYPITVTVTDGVASATATTSATTSSATTTLNIGESVVLSGTDGGNGNLLLAQPATLSQVATLVSLSFYVRVAGGDLRLGIYDATGPSGHPGKLVAQTAAFTPVVGWNTKPIATPVTLQPGTYWLAYLPQSSNLQFPVTQGGVTHYWYNFTYAALPATFSTTPNAGSAHWSLYATLSAQVIADTTAPSIPTGLIATPTSTSQIILGWTASADNVGVTGYNVIRDGTNVGTNTTTSFADSGLATASTHTYAVSAFDAAGNTSPLSAAVSATTLATAPPPSQVLPPDRVIDWSKPGMTARGGIPNRTTIFRTLTPSGGDDTGQIQAALDACPANQVVKLSAGVFNTTGLTVNTPNITLRGSGPGQALGFGKLGTFVPDPSATQIKKSVANAAPIIAASGHDAFNNWASSSNLTANALRGSFSIMVASNMGAQVGELVLIDQITNNHPDVFWGPNHDGPGGGSRRWYIRQDRSLVQLLLITAVNGNTITFETPLHCDFLTQYTAQLTRFGDTIMTGIGIEDLYVFGDTGGNAQIGLNSVTYSWIKHCEAQYHNGHSVTMTNCYRCELRDSFLHEASNPNPGGSSYILDINWFSSDCLVENNIMWYADKNITIRGGGGGNVVAYNYMDDAFMQVAPDLPESGLNASHYTTEHMSLLEGNYTHQGTCDCGWGNAIDITFFRNHFSGLRAAHPPLNTFFDGSTPYCDIGIPRAAVKIGHGTVRNNFVGNILGYQGQALLHIHIGSYNQDQTQFLYEYGPGAPPPPSFIPDGLVPMWFMGEEDDDSAHTKWVYPDTYKLIWRNGNFDWVSQTQVWYASPQGASGLPGNGTSISLPNSLYLTSKPTFFGSNPWPWVNPATGLTTVLPAKARFDAGTPNAI